MSYSYIYEPIALSEYKEAIAWYVERSEKAAENFALQIKTKILEICSDPLRYRNTYKNFIETSLKKYPYCIVYFVDEPAKKVIITSVFHHKRNPRKKYRK